MERFWYLLRFLLGGSLDDLPQPTTYHILIFVVAMLEECGASRFI
jgi:hypothetical protein